MQMFFFNNRPMLYNIEFLFNICLIYLARYEESLLDYL